MTIHIHHYYCLLLDCWLHINNMHNVAQHIISAIFHMHRYASEKISKLETEGKLTRRSQSHSTGPLKRIDKVRHSGRETLDEANSEYQALPQPSQVVLHILEPYLDQGQHVFTDRYYTSIPLAKTLKSTTFTGTVMKNRADLRNKIKGRLQLRSEVIAFQDGDLLALASIGARKKPVNAVYETHFQSQLFQLPPLQLSNTHNVLYALILAMLFCTHAYAELL